jgi:beta-lactamase class A
VSDLLDRVRARAAEAGGRVGAVVLDGEGREVFALDPDGVYPSASVIKLPLVMALYWDAAEGRLSVDEQMPIGKRVGGSGVLGGLTDVTSMSVRDLATLTMQVSDNTATNHVIDRVGLERVNERMREWGCPGSHLARRMLDEDAKARGLQNVMTPRETASLVRRVVAGAAEGSWAAREVLRLMEGNANQLRLGFLLPRGVTLGHKDGWLSDPEFSDNDAGVIRVRTSVVVVGFTHRVHPVIARRLLGLLGLAAAELAGADLSALPLEVLRGA